MEPIKILVVDDSLVVRGMLTKLFEADKWIRVVGAVATAADADSVIAQQSVDVVSLDVEMPGMNGLDYLPSLARRRIPTIIVSSRASEQSEVRAIALSRGAASCFNKEHAVRDATMLLHDVRVAALQGHKPPGAGVFGYSTGSSVIQNAAIEQLIADHGTGLTQFVAERIGYATLDGDMAGVAKWVSIGRGLQAVQNRVGDFH
jgi:CheY-like chemotaxis protein